MVTEVTGFRVGMKRTVSLGNYESCAFECSLSVQTDAGLDVETDEGKAALRASMKNAYDQVARVLYEERLRRLKTPDDQVNVTHKVGGMEVVVQR